MPDLRARLRPGRGAARLPAVLRGWGGAALAGQPHRKDSFELELAEPGRKPTCRLRLGLSWSLSHVQIRQLLVRASPPERAPKFYPSSPWDTPSAQVLRLD